MLLKWCCDVLFSPCNCSQHGRLSKNSSKQHNWPRFKPARGYIKARFSSLKQCRFQVSVRDVRAANFFPTRDRFHFSRLSNKPVKCENVLQKVYLTRLFMARILTAVWTLCLVPGGLHLWRRVLRVVSNDNIVSLAIDGHSLGETHRLALIPLIK